MVWKKRSEGREKEDEEWWRLLSAVSASSTLMRVTSKGKARELEDVLVRVETQPLMANLVFWPTSSGGTQCKRVCGEE